MKRSLMAAAAAAALAMAIACGSGSSDCPTCPTPDTNPTPGSGGSGPDATTQFLIGAGDVGDCANPGASQTGNLIKTLRNSGSFNVFAAGDLAYDMGTAQQFASCYDPHWGTFRNATYSVPGNHEYVLSSAPYYAYFGVRSLGDTGQGYYTFDMASWRVIMLNSEVDFGAGSAQEQWLRARLQEAQAASKQCVAAIWHKPRFSSGAHGRDNDGAFTKDMWKALYDFRADLIVNGHEHMFERYSPMDGDGKLDDARGIVQYVVGTGGATLSDIKVTPANRAYIRTGEWGILKLTLGPGSFTSEFISTTSGTHDVYTRTCR